MRTVHDWLYQRTTETEIFSGSEKNPEAISGPIENITDAGEPVVSLGMEYHTKGPTLYHFKETKT